MNNVTSISGSETLSFAQRDRLGRIITKELPVRQATVYSLGDKGYEIDVKPAVDRNELESITGKFIANRLVHHQPAEIIETDR